jgi:cysteine desulfurase
MNDKGQETFIMKPIYLDYNATTPIDDEVAEAMIPYLKEHFGNPSSLYLLGINAKNAVEKARKGVADLLNCTPEEIIFTSGGTESNNLALKGVAFANRKKGKHLITSQVEHPAVKEVFRHLETQGFQITYVPVDDTGLINVKALHDAIRPDTVLMSIMHANNEVGTIQPIGELAHIAGRHGIILHTDAAQSAGKIPTDVKKLGVDLLSVAGHKVYAPKGIGALYVRKGIKLEKFVHGAGQERNMRAGTENVLEIVGLGKACEIAKRNREKNMAHMTAMRNRLRDGLIGSVPDIRVNGHLDLLLPNTLSVGFKNMDATFLLSKMEGIYASAGSACHAGSTAISDVLAAMHVPEEYARGTVRFSTGKLTTKEEIDRVIVTIRSVMQAIKQPMYNRNK